MIIASSSITDGICVTCFVLASLKYPTSKYWLFQITNLMHNSFIFQQYVCYTTLLNMFRAARCSSSGGQIVSPQPLVSSPSVSSRTEGDDTRGCGNTICPPEDEQRAARNMLRSVV